MKLSAIADLIEALDELPDIYKKSPLWLQENRRVVGVVIGVSTHPSEYDVMLDVQLNKGE